MVEKEKEERQVVKEEKQEVKERRLKKREENHQEAKEESQVVKEENQEVKEESQVVKEESQVVKERSLEERNQKVEETKYIFKLKNSLKMLSYKELFFGGDVFVFQKIFLEFKNFKKKVFRKNFYFSKIVIQKNIFIHTHIFCVCGIIFFRKSKNKKTKILKVSYILKVFYSL